MLFNLKVLLYLDFLLLIGLLGFRRALLPSVRSMVSPKAITLVLLTPAVVLIGGNIYLFHVYLICAVGLTSRTRSELCGIYLLMTSLVPAMTFSLVVGGVYLMSVASFASMNVGALIGMALTRGRVRRTDPLLDFSVLMILIVFTFMELRGVSATAMLRIILQNALFVVPPYLLVSRSVVNLEDVRKLLLHLCLAAFLGSIVAIFGILRHWDLYGSFFGALGVTETLGSSTLAVRGGLMRMGGPFHDYSAFGLFLAAIIAVLPALRRSFGRMEFLAVAAVLLLGIVSTQSRGAWIGMILGFVTFELLRNRRMMAVAMIAGGGAVYVLLRLVLAPSSRFADAVGSGGAGLETAQYRWRLLVRGLEQVEAHPVLGQNPAKLIENMPDMMQGQHIVDFVNSHLFVAMSTGLVGFAIWAVVWISVAGRVIARRSHHPAEIRRSGLSIVPVAMIVSSCVTLTFTSISDRNLFWLLVPAAFSTPVLTRRGSASADVRNASDERTGRRVLVAHLP